MRDSFECGTSYTPVHPDVEQVQNVYLEASLGVNNASLR